MAEELTEGWAFPGSSRKAHYMRGMESLCRKWGFYRGPLEAGDAPSPDDCADCRRRRDKEVARG